MTITGVGVTSNSSNNKSTIIVKIDSGSIVKCSNGVVTKTATEKEGQWRFNNIDNGVWTITAIKGDAKAEENVTVNRLDVYYIDMTYVNIFGISRDITASSPAWARTDMAVGMSAKASVGTSAGKSDFDNVMPWKGIVRENIGSDVMVKIPKFYYQRNRSGNIEHIRIADKPKSGFKVHPLFTHNSKESECAYIGAYKTSSGNKSVSGASPQVDQTRAVMRNNAKSKGAGWSLMDVAALSAIQMLMLVEYADNNTQQVIGRGYCEGGNSLKTGSCNKVPGLTGRPAGTDGEVDVVYRGIEGLWGNVSEWIDGVNFGNDTCYVSNDSLKYSDDTTTGYAALSYKPIGVHGYITEMGLDTGANTHIMLPVLAKGSETTGFCDRSSLEDATEWEVLSCSGAYNDHSNSGLFNASSHRSFMSYLTVGSRLLYIPS